MGPKFQLSRPRISSSYTLRCRHITTRILAGVVVVFVVCWTPWNVHSLLAEFLHESVSGPHFKFVDLLLKAFAVSSAAVNPFLYCWLNANFRHVAQLFKLHG